MDAFETAAAIRARELSPVAAVDASLAAIDSLDGVVNAFTVTFFDEARAAAHRAEKRVMDAEPPPPLLGVPVSVKDHIWMSGAPATNGSFAFQDFVPDEDCACVARLRQSGAIIVGKTNNPEFCYRGYTDNRLWGATRNPWDLDRTPGGSSGGAGASVCAGMTAIGLGTDGGGSIRIPSSFCGIVGHKPSFGLVPKEPGFPNWRTLSVDGPLASSARDAALLLSVVAGAHPADDTTRPAPAADFIASATQGLDVGAVRVACSSDLGFAPVDPGARRVFERATEALADAGFALEEAHPGLPDPSDLWNFIAACEGFASEGPLLAQWEAKMTSGIPALIRAGESATAADYLDALHRRARLTRAWREFFDRFDLLVTPALPVTAFPIGREGPESIDGIPISTAFDDWCSICYPANLTGHPAASVPAGFADGLPVGLQIMGRLFEDDLVLAAAAEWERIAPWARELPPVHASGNGSRLP